ncbi:MAG: NYN domain-containing protein [Candidatus Paceibacterota bacterium]
MDTENEKKFALIDAQNLYFGTTKCDSCAKALGIELKQMQLTDCTCSDAWEVDLEKFRIYLAENYAVKEAYYVLGYFNEKHDELYKEIQKAGFIILFKEHNSKAKSLKKGNVDTDIVFEVMRSLIENSFDKVIIVSGDGDYKKLIYYLVGKNKFKKILFPNKKFASSLYKALGSEHYDYLDNIKSYIEKVKNNDAVDKPTEEIGPINEKGS